MLYVRFIPLFHISHVVLFFIFLVVLYRNIVDFCMFYLETLLNAFCSSNGIVVEHRIFCIGSNILGIKTVLLRPF